MKARAWKGCNKPVWGKSYVGICRLRHGHKGPHVDERVK